MSVLTSPVVPPKNATTGDLQITNVTKSFGAFTAVDDLTLTVPQGSFFALLGASGCGKTTTLRMVAGLEEPTTGQITLGGKDITRLRPYNRPVNTVFQSYALFPHMSVADNVGFGLKQRKTPRKEIGVKVAEMLDLVQLGSLASRRPAQLSGGQQQRVALARALINHPQVLLLDEPLGALDLKLRRQMQIELKRIQTEVGITFVHVTHDQEEAMTMADTVAVMNAGKIEQLGSPTEIYEFPATVFVANFLGQSNLLTSACSGTSGDDVLVEAYGSRFAVPRDRSRVTAGPAFLGVRPEKLHLVESALQVPDGHNAVPGVITDSSYVGVSTQYLVSAPWGEELSIFAPNSGTSSPLRPGANVVVHWHPQHSFLLAGAGAVASQGAPETAAPDGGSLL
ncbi:spermidine/putrescine transport system ATP-binding protein [Allocatelliglobosispora scoriae]|uniref:Spermidine/putrescine import ATP-binding protein PotA n=1 Tax=Allocatelliglobosispora scoriae TaxID=643052 RepID=A0A841BPS0_9ACTN|nr:ABC transporter ATP-binding protein [Allocatelliglobosispora scoriae]MBB5870264.1 spermidine/putrescine transport system ATP-binding protein [Allocatelliglobosispora scoriae]